MQMSETYVECLIKQKTSIVGIIFKSILIALTVLFGVFSLAGILVAFIIAIITGVCAYYVNLYSNLEYEYLYLDKELTVDKIMAKTKRKKVAVYTIDRIEILAPIHSYHLDNYKNRNVKTKDYSIGEELKPDKRYVMYYEGGEKVLLSPSEELVEAMRNIAPRKIFKD